MFGPPGVMAREKHRQRREREHHPVRQCAFENQIVIALVSQLKQAHVEHGAGHPRRSNHRPQGQMGRRSRQRHLGSCTCQTAQCRPRRIAKQLAHFGVRAQDRPAPLAMPHSLGFFIIRHTVENIDLEAGENRRRAAKHPPMKPRPKPFAGAWRRRTGIRRIRIGSGSHIEAFCGGLGKRGKICARPASYPEAGANSIIGAPVVPTCRTRIGYLFATCSIAV